MSNPKTRTITLTDRAPIRIVESDWPQVAVARWHDGQYESQANRTAHVRVRQHADGRRIVYGGSTSQWQGERGTDAGYLLDAPPDEQRTVAAIHDVAEAVGRPDLADECIADLPAQDLV